MIADGGYLRTGDLGRLDADGYLWITGRAKDLIIRGGHNIDPAMIEEALMAHPAVAFAGAIGQPDAHAGELPAAYVELVRRRGGRRARSCSSTPARTSPSRRRCRSTSRSLPELPKTAVGKVFKPDLRRRAIARVFDAALAAAGSAARVAEVVEDRRLGLVAVVAPGRTGATTAVAAALGGFTVPWRWQARRVRRRLASGGSASGGGTPVIRGYAIEDGRLRPLDDAARGGRRGWYGSTCSTRPRRRRRRSRGARLEVPTREEMAEIEDFEPALHRERRDLHDRRSCRSAPRPDGCAGAGHLHPRRRPSGHRALS